MRYFRDQIVLLCLCWTAILTLHGGVVAFVSPQQPSAQRRARRGAVVSSRTTSLPTMVPLQPAQRSLLFASSSSSSSSDKHNKRGRRQRLVSFFQRATASLSIPNTNGVRRRWSMLRRRLVTLCVAFMLSFGVVMNAGTIPPAAHAAAAASTSTPVVERIFQKTSPSLDQIVDKYVRDHMFDDDIYDPVESLYREAYDDATRGSHLAALKQVTGLSISGKAADAADTTTSTNNNPFRNIQFGTLLTNTLKTLQSKLGLSESVAIMVLAAVFVVAGPAAFLFTGMIIGGISKRNMNQLMKKRYGDTYSVDATLKPDDDVEAPDDDDDDDDDKDNDDDDDDDDDDDI